ncbi:MAG TPA: hypothetical protein VMZ69_11390 [Saprospiraceae bacterium]|nr:hypothetical protein [Saprospiraceae bacterium]
MRNILINSILVICATICIMSCDKDEDHPIVLTAAGNIQATLDEYRSMLGADNGGTAGSQISGRRELNWDGVPDSLAAPNLLPHDFFNTNVGNRARGADFTTPGSGVQVSADSNNPFSALPSFGNINPTYQQTFQPFSAERVFSPIGSNIVDLRFFVPGSTTPAVVKGFGAIYIDVDNQENTAFEYFDIDDNSLGVYATPVLNEGHVFLGVIFETPRVHRVRIEYGNSPLGPNDGSSVDVAVMDDFIYGEPQEAQ